MLSDIPAHWLWPRGWWHRDFLHYGIVHALPCPDIELVAQRIDLRPETYEAIAQQPRWMRSYTVRRNLAANPATPRHLAHRLLAELRDCDLERIANSPRSRAETAALAAELPRTR